jgi:uncharacterized membrane protein
MDAEVLTVCVVIASAMSTYEVHVKHVQEIVRSDRKKSVDQIASEVEICIRSCYCVLHDVLNMCCVHQCFVP